MPNIGLPELALVLVIVLLVFGAGKLPDIGRALGKSINEFKKAKTEGEETKPTVEPTKAK
jgi:sec-independent protein translocase protein TatA